ncbi:MULTISPECIES: spermidine synthase [Actinomadura]|uniref:Spermidine synthase n=2 Tax=Actinomadura TaxID=1988 RepID=A0A7D3W2H8_ACTVE|nr:MULTISPECIES: fused MFS/spermidine synthase [Actinomadura]MBO2463652.1 fused MFS/spermidine synthase [Actinomadura violacea]QKG27498.1 spermidine synthase [Actinomadura verrucosospora]
MARKGRHGPRPDTFTIAGGEAELLRDADRDGGWMLLVGGVPQSYVDLSDPTYLDFEYMRLMGDVVDALGLDGEAFDVVHIGGAGCTLPRYIAATRPGSRQIVLEPDAELVRVVRERLPVKGVPGLRIRVTDGRSGIAALADEADDLVVMDAFAEASMPPELATREFVLDAARVLRPRGVYLANVADGFRLPFARRVAATVRSVFPHALLMGDPGVLRGRRFGNLIVAASREPLPVAELTRRAAGGIARARMVAGDDLAAFCAGAAPLHDGEEITAPTPPPQVFGRS